MRAPPCECVELVPVTSGVLLAWLGSLALIESDGFNPEKQNPTISVLYITQTKQLTQHVVSSVAFSWAGVANQDENTGMSTLKVFVCSSVGPVIPPECFRTDVSSRPHQFLSTCTQFPLLLMFYRCVDEDESCVVGP